LRCEPRSDRSLSNLKDRSNLRSRKDAHTLQRRDNDWIPTKIGGQSCSAVAFPSEGHLCFTATDCSGFRKQVGEALAARLGSKVSPQIFLK
jgi:hypothetical protein